MVLLGNVSKKDYFQFHNRVSYNFVVVQILYYQLRVYHPRVVHDLFLLPKKFNLLNILNYNSVITRPAPGLSLMFPKETLGKMRNKFNAFFVKSVVPIVKF